MKRLATYIGTALLAFVVGAIAASLWKSSQLRSHTQTPGPLTAAVGEEEWPLTKVIVSRALQSHSFSTAKLRRNSREEIIWRWLKQSIAEYPQNWVKLNISETESYGIVLYPLQMLEDTELIHINRELNEKGLPPLHKGKRYLPINVYQGDIICPSWSGYIDVEEAKLVYFVGESA